jgi:hypothetical protein
MFIEVMEKLEKQKWDGTEPVPPQVADAGDIA